jgi:hypothetical protein
VSNDEIEQVKQTLSRYERSYRRSEILWKYGHRFLLFFSALFSIGAAIIGKLEWFKIAAATPSDIATILAGLATATTTLIAAFDFKVNWRINSKSRHEMHVIMRESEKLGADHDTLLGQLQQVIKQHSNADLNQQD